LGNHLGFIPIGSIVFGKIEIKQNDECSLAKTLPETDINACKAKSSPQLFLTLAKHCGKLSVL